MPNAPQLSGEVWSVFRRLEPVVELFRRYGVQAMFCGSIPRDTTAISPPTCPKP